MKSYVISSVLFGVNNFILFYPFAHSQYWVAILIIIFCFATGLISGFVGVAISEWINNNKTWQKYFTSLRNIGS